MKAVIKNLIQNIANSIPYGRDIFLLLMKGRLGISYRGVFNNYQQAADAVAQTTTDYDVINRNKAVNESNELKTIDTWFQDIDYPLLFWESKLVTPQCHILELGGSIGHFFYSSQCYHKFPDDIFWTIAELPEAVKLGAKIAKDRNEQRLSFIDSSTIDTTQPCNVFVSAGTLQYIDQPLTAILSKLNGLPEHVLIHNLPCHHNQGIWTLQNLNLCEVPYYIYNLQELKRDMQKLGYKVIAQWTTPRSIEIPFHRDLAIEGYLGFYFQQN